MRFFTSDWHINSSLICKYAKREICCKGLGDNGGDLNPASAWDRGEVAANNERILLENCNKVASKDDLVVHNGDFMLVGFDRHGEDTDDGSILGRTKHDIVSKVAANLLLLDGNHDAGHNSTSDAQMMTIDLNDRYRKVTVAHLPSFYDGRLDEVTGRKLYGYAGTTGSRIHDKLHIHLCGHVHQSWLVYYDAINYVLNINVGCDVWNYTPVSEKKLVQLLDFLFGFNHSGCSLTFNKRDIVITNEGLAKLKAEVHAKKTNARRDAKAERMAKKGLTKEECERRKQAAIAMKQKLKAERHAAANSKAQAS